MMTWTFNVNRNGVWYIGTVTADNVTVARDLIYKNHEIDVSNDELIPLPTHHRHLRTYTCHFPKRSDT